MYMNILKLYITNCYLSFLKIIIQYNVNFISVTVVKFGKVYFLAYYNT